MSSGTLSTYPRLVGDVGGTNARFALVHEPGRELEGTESLPCSEFPDIASAIDHYLKKQAVGTPKWSAIGIANPITGDWVQMTNHHWSFSIDKVKRSLGLDRLLVINDFTALALSLLSLHADDLQQVGGTTAEAGQPKALLGAGTGLGVSGLIPHGDIYTPISGEGGHCTLPPRDAEEMAVITNLNKRFHHVSAERVLSGPGLQLLHQALAEVRGVTTAPMQAPQITDAAINNHDALCIAVVNMFCAMLGTVAGNLTLTLGARGGAYIGGGIVPKLGPFFTQSPFRERFDSKGRFKEYLASIPAYVIQARYPGLTGAAVALDR